MYRLGGLLKQVAMQQTIVCTWQALLATNDANPVQEDLLVTRLSCITVMLFYHALHSAEAMIAASLAISLGS